MRIEYTDIGGGVVKRGIIAGDERLNAGTRLSGDEIRAKFRPLNLRCLIDTMHIAVWPKSGREPGRVVGDEPGHPGVSDAPGQRHLVNRGFGVYDVIEGQKINDKPVDRDTANALIEQGAAAPN